MIQSIPERAMICTVWIEGMVAIAPKVGRPSRHSWRRRLSGAGFAEVKGGNSLNQTADSKMSDLYHMDKSMAYRGTLFLRHRTWF
jgi:hypothetical protein